MNKQSQNFPVLKRLEVFIKFSPKTSQNLKKPFLNEYFS